MELSSPKPVSYFSLQNTCSSVLIKSCKDLYWHLHRIILVTTLLTESPGQHSYRSRLSRHSLSNVPTPLHFYTSHLKLLSLSVWYKCTSFVNKFVESLKKKNNQQINALGPLEGQAKLSGGSISFAGRLFPQQNDSLVNIA